MLSLITPANAVPARMRSLLGAWLDGGSTSVHCDLARGLVVLPVPDGAQGIAMPFARPQARKAADLPGYGAQAAGQVELARQQRNRNVQNSYTTRIATRTGAIVFSAKDGGHLGPLPPRDPV